MQICINNAWGAVCDDLFDVYDAHVACQQAGGYERELVGDITSVAITGPEFVSQLGCEGEEDNLLDCPIFTHIGSECESGNNAVITCRGYYYDTYFDTCIRSACVCFASMNRTLM